MPIYEYQCAYCGEKFEVGQAIGENGSGLSCPKCCAENPKRLFSSFFSPGSSISKSSGTTCPTCSSGVCELPQME